MRSAVLALVLIAAPLAAQMGSPGGGETQAIALHPTNPQVIYVGAAKGLCKTTRGGLDNWPAVGLETYSPRALAIVPDRPDTVYAGTYEMGVWKTTDGGQTWGPANEGLTYKSVRALVLAEDDSNAVFAGTDGGGVFRSDNGGASWTEKNHGLIDKVVRALVIHQGKIFAATWHGIYWSTDRGENWQADPNGLYDVDVQALAVAPSDPQVMYAGTNPRGVYRSEDGGRTWVRGKNVIGEVILSLAVDPADARLVFAGTRAGVWRSRDGGDTFEPAGLSWSNAAWALVFDARTQPPTLYYGGIGGVLKTTTAGAWWNVTGPVRK